MAETSDCDMVGSLHSLQREHRGGAAHVGGCRNFRAKRTTLHAVLGNQPRAVGQLGEPVQNGASVEPAHVVRGGTGRAREPCDEQAERETQAADDKVPIHHHIACAAPALISTRTGRAWQQSCTIAHVVLQTNAVAALPGQRINGIENEPAGPRAAKVGDGIEQLCNQCLLGP